jgi:hypothetical protein
MESVLSFLDNTCNLDEDQKVQRLNDLKIKEFYQHSLFCGLDALQLKKTAELVKGNKYELSAS